MSAGVAIAVLIVEDERLVAKDLQESLGEMGYDAFAIAASAQEALDHAAKRLPDIVLMDIRIKGPADGIETAALLKAKYPVVIVYLTAHSDAVLRGRAQLTDPAGYLVKPVSDTDLRNMLEFAVASQDSKQP